MKPKHTLIAQIKALERRKHGKLDRYALVDNKGKVIEKYRLRFTASQELIRQEKIHFQKLKIVDLDENGKPVVTKER